MAIVSNLNGRNPLYNNVYSDVRYEMSARTKIYGNRVRGRNGLEWHLQKKPYCVVKWYDRLTNKTQTVLGDNDNDKTFDRLYDTYRMVPRPVLISADITNQGEMGSLQTAEVNFKVYNREQLEEIESKILTPGQEVIIDYGWTVGRVGSPPQSKRSNFEPRISPNRDIFNGVIDNYSISSNPDLSFTVSFSCVGEGFFAYGVSANAKDKNTLKASLAETVTDSNGQELVIDSLQLKIEKDISEAQLSGKNGIFLGRAGGTPIRYAYQEIAYDSSKENKKDETDTNDPTQILNSIGNLSVDRAEEQTFFFIPLSDLLWYYNKSILSQEPNYNIDGSKPKVWFSANYKNEQSNPSVFPYGIRSVSVYDTNVTSCIPTDILFNGGLSDPIKHSANYSLNQDAVDSANGNFRVNPKNGQRVEFERPEPALCDLGEILVSTKLINEILDKLTLEENEPVHKSIISFFNEIFQRVNYASGSLYQLTFIQEEIMNYATGKQRSWIIVVDKNFTYNSEKIKPLRFNVESGNTPIVKKLDMSSNIPSAMATKLYVGGRTGMTDIPGDAGRLTKTASELSSIEAQNAQKAMAVEYGLKKVRAKMGEVGSTETLRSSMHSLLKGYRESPPKHSQLYQNKDFVNQTIFPINLSVTIDGISGFRFGNVIDVDYLPKRYFGEDGQPKVVFIVTKVNHTLTPSVWETTLETQCRANMTQLVTIKN